MLGTGALRRRSGGGRRRRAPTARGGPDRPRGLPHPGARRGGPRGVRQGRGHARPARVAAIPGSVRSSTRPAGAGSTPRPRSRPVSSCPTARGWPRRWRPRSRHRSVRCHQSSPSTASATPPPRCARWWRPPARSTPSSWRLGGGRPSALRDGTGGSRCSPSTGTSSGTPHRRRLGPGRRRLRRRRRPSGPAGDPHRRHHHRGAAAGPRPPHSTPGSPPSATEGRVTAFAAGLEAPEEVAGRTAGALVAHLLDHPEAAALAGAELVGRRRMARPAQPPPTDRQRHLRRARTSPTGWTATLREIVGATDRRRRMDAR